MRRLACMIPFLLAPLAATADDASDPGQAGRLPHGDAPAGAGQAGRPPHEDGPDRRPPHELHPADAGQAERLPHGHAPADAGQAGRLPHGRDPADADGVVGSGLDAAGAVSFADQLLAAKDPFNALTFYRLGLFLGPDDPAVRFKIALAYELGDRHLAAEQAYLDLAGRFSKWSPRATYRAAMSLAEAGNLGVARLHLGDVVLEGEGTGWADRARTADAILVLRQGDLAGARAAFAAIGHDEAVGLLDQRVPRRSPALAGVLSTVVPGAGQLYAGHPGDAAMAFVASGLLGLWSCSLLRYGIEEDRGWAVPAGAVLGGMAVLTWSSNVVGAVRGARRSNRHRLRRFTEDVLREVDDPRLELDPEDVSPPG